MRINSKLIGPFVGLSLLSSMGSCEKKVEEINYANRSNEFVEIRGDSLMYEKIKMKGLFFTSYGILTARKSGGLSVIYLDRDADLILDALITVRDGEISRYVRSNPLHKASILFAQGEYHNYLFDMGIINRMPEEDFEL